MNDIDDLFLNAIENTARRNYQLAIRQATEFRRQRAHLRKPPKPFNSREYLSDPLMSCLGLVERNVIRARIELLNRRVCPDYLSHRFNRCLAWLWVEVRPSWMALSPRAIPSKSRSRF